MDRHPPASEARRSALVRGHSCMRFSTNRCMGQVQRTSGRECYPLKLYVQGAQEMWALYNATTILLATDSPVVAYAQRKHSRDIRWISLPVEQTMLEGRAAGPPAWKARGGAKFLELRAEAGARCPSERSSPLRSPTCSGWQARTNYGFQWQPVWAPRVVPHLRAQRRATVAGMPTASGTFIAMLPHFRTLGLWLQRTPAATSSSSTMPCASCLRTARSAWCSRGIAGWPLACLGETDGYPVHPVA